MYESARTSGKSLIQFFGLDRISQIDHPDPEDPLSWRRNILASCKLAFRERPRGVANISYSQLNDRLSTYKHKVQKESTNEAEPGSSKDAEERLDEDTQSTHEPQRAGFSLQAAFSEMDCVNLDDEGGIKNRIADVMTPTERDHLMFTQHDEAEIMAALKVPVEQSHMFHPSSIRLNDQTHPRPTDASITESIAHYQKLHSTTFANLARFALGALCSNKIDNTWLKFLAANATRDSRERLLRILHHGSVQPLAMQYAPGQKTWSTDLFDSFDPLYIDDKGSLDNSFSQYHGICQTAEATWIYEGSATGYRTKVNKKHNYLFGEADRMYNGHRLSLNGQPHPLFIHRLMMGPHIKRCFISSVRFPIMETVIYRAKVRTLAVLSEILSMILLATAMPEPSKPAPRDVRNRSFAWMSQMITAAVRPQEAPKPLWRGANKVLPLLQSPVPVYGLLGFNPSRMLNDLLISHWQTTRERSLRE